MPRQTPDICLEWTVNTVPSGTDVYRFSRKPLADQDSFKEPRLRSVGTVTRRLSTDDGDSHSPSVDVSIDDADGLVRGILSAVATRSGVGEAALQISSETNRKAGGDWSELFRGRVVNPQAPPGRMASLRIEGVVGSRFTGVDLNKTIPSQRIGGEHPNAPETSVGLVYPLILGEHSDVGATDVNGNSVEKGILPAIDCGDVLMLADGTEVDPDDGVITYLDVPTNLTATVEGTAGSESHTYAVTALSHYGETTAVTLTIDDAPDLLNGTDRVLLEWDSVEDAIAYRVYRDHKRIALLNNGGAYTTPETTYTDVGVDGVSPAPPSANTAQIFVTVNGEEAYGWTRFVAAGKACHVEHLYGWDGADGIAPKRARVAADRIGWDAEVLLPGEADWPHATDYLDLERPDGTIIRQTCFYARGPLVHHHRNKSVTLAWNGWGVEDVGDLTGDPIIQAFPGLLWLLNEEVLKNDGAGYTTGDYGPLQEFSNGVDKLKASKFHECQNTSKRFLGNDVGYIINLALTEPITVRELLRRFHMTFGSFDGTTRLGQWFPVLVDDLELDPDASDGLSPLRDEALISPGNLGDETLDDAPPTGAYTLSAERRAYRDTVNVIRFIDQKIHHDKAQTTVQFDMSWDNDAQRFRLPDQKIPYNHLAYGHSEPKQKPKRRVYYTDDTATAYDAQDRYLRRHLYAPRDVVLAVDYEGLDDELGNEAWLTHYEGAGSSTGDSESRMFIIGHDPNPDDDEVILTLRDMSRFVRSSLSPLQDEDVMDGNLGDETSDAAPPTGAEVLT